MTHSSRPEIRGSVGTVASTHYLASAAAMSMLERGGNAFDAAVAAGFVLQVAEPHQNGPGGEVVMIIHAAETDEVLVVNGQGPTPERATIGLLRDEYGLSVVPGVGLTPACVPGAFDAWMVLLGRFGSRHIAEVLSYAVDLATAGAPVNYEMAAVIREVEPLFRSSWPSSAATYTAGGFPTPGHRLARPALARTYARIVAEAEAKSKDRVAQIEAARAVWSNGFVAEAIVAFCEDPPVRGSSVESARGLLSPADFAAYSARLEPAVSLDYRGLTVHKPGPWSQGPAMLEVLAILRGSDVAGMGLGSADYIHLLVEATKLAYADREAWYGDQDSVDVPLTDLLSDDYAERRRGLVATTASDPAPGAVIGRRVRLPAPTGGPITSSRGAGEPSITHRRDTSHVAVADRFGNMVAAMPSGGWLQSSPLIPDLGFCLGTRAQMLWLEDGLASSFGPRRLPRTTLSPSLVTRDGQAVLAFGSPGGDGQDQWGLQFLLAHVDFGLDLQEATEVPSFYTDHFASSFYPRASFPRRVHVEDRVGRAVIRDLRTRGHDVVVEAPWSLGWHCAVGFDRASGFLLAGASPRGARAYAMGR